MLHGLPLIPAYFQSVLAVLGSSLQHRCDMAPDPVGSPIRIRARRAEAGDRGRDALPCVDQPLLHQIVAIDLCGPWLIGAEVPHRE